MALARPGSCHASRSLDGTGGLGFTNPASLAARALIALVIEAILAALTITWLRRTPAPGPQARSANP